MVEEPCLDSYYLRVERRAGDATRKRSRKAQQLTCAIPVIKNAHLPQKLKI
jgi:hypothetical protein